MARKRSPVSTLDPVLMKQIALLNSGDATKREAALSAIRQLDPQTVVNSVLDAYTWDKQHQKRYWGLMIGGMLGVISLVTTVCYIIVGIIPFGGIVGGLVPLLLLRFILKQGRDNFINILALFDDKRCVGPLVDALTFGSPRTRGLAETALTRLLPQLQASDAPLLNATQRERLYRELNGNHVELTLALLKALEQIGDEKALLPVENLASGRGLAQPYPHIGSAARECLPFLRARAAQSTVGNQLLRASAQEQSAPETLLRSAEPDETNTPSTRPSVSTSR